MANEIKMQEQLQTNSVFCTVINSKVEVMLDFVRCPYFDGELGRHNCTKSSYHTPCKVYESRPSDFEHHPICEVPLGEAEFHSGAESDLLDA